ncbi:MAG: glycosyltransferase family 39 protein, partial [Candidatus Villigracilaceae bacterium]
RVGLLPFVAIYLWVIIASAWVSDDAFITFRSIENVVHGYGLVFNIGERVQTFTHPLWLLLQTGFYVLINGAETPFGLNKLYFVNVFLSLCLSLVTVILYSFRVTRSSKDAILGLLILIASKAFIDYSTSGLENPLSHIIAVSFFGVFLADKKDEHWSILGLSFLAGLGMLNRMDTILLYLPTLIFVMWKDRNHLKTIFLVCIGFLPIILWELFSLFYYGSLFPNTASAKLNIGISQMTLFRQGVYYFMNSLRMDPITLSVIASLVALSLLTKNLQRILVVFGIILYLFYILSIGGDFMSGRYFSLPLLVAVIALSTFNIKPLPLYSSILVSVLVVGLLPLYIVNERGFSYGSVRENNLVFFDKHKISDERLVYAERTGLLAAIQGNSPKVVYSQEDWVASKEYPVEVHVFGALGMNGYRDGPNVHVIDRNGLADPLMAKMPLDDTKNWRIGHFHHIIPDGYIETLSSGENRLQDANIALYYDRLSFVIKGPLWDWNRIIEIWNLNTGRYDSLLPAK